MAAALSARTVPRLCESQALVINSGPDLATTVVYQELPYREAAARAYIYIHALVNAREEED